eukprot:1615246-Amphidinium_carterae.1
MDPLNCGLRLPVHGRPELQLVLSLSSAPSLHPHAGYARCCSTQQVSSALHLNARNLSQGVGF